MIIVHGDGYLGDPDAGRYDRIIATCGIAGIPPAWLDQLTDKGWILAPIAHAGVHPIVALHQTASGLTGTSLFWADFMPAAGGMRPTELFSHDPSKALPAAGVSHRDGVFPALAAEHYNDLTFSGATQSRAGTC